MTSTGDGLKRIRYNEEADSLARKETKKLNIRTDELAGEEIRTPKPKNFQQYKKRKADSSARKETKRFKHQNFQQLPKKKKKKPLNLKVGLPA